MDDKEKFERAKLAIKKCGNNKGRISMIESIFPELGDSEDERIRKGLIKAVSGTMAGNTLFGTDVTREEALAWLEKQATVEHFELKKGHWYMCHRAYCCRADNLTVKEGERFQCEKDGIVKGFVIKDPEKYFIEVHAPAPMEDYQNDEVRRRSTIQVLEYAKSLDAYNQYGKEDIDKDIAWLEKQVSPDMVADAYLRGCNDTEKKWLEKQGENTLIEEIKRRKELFSREKEKAVSSTEKLSLGGRIAVLEELLVFVKEKQGEQTPILDFKARNWYVSKVDGKIHDLTYNPADNKTKFKIGDWIVGTLEGYYKVLSVEREYGTGKYDYILLEPLGNETAYGKEFVDEHFHLWTIRDVVNGDVLVNGSNIFMFHFINDTRLMGYCHVNTDDGRFYDDIGKNECFCLIDAVVNPATKEQRDILFRKMKEAGYEWDVSKKELKKINSYCQENCNGYQEAGKCFADGECDAKRKADQESTAWSEEDEVYLKQAIEEIEYALNDKNLIYTGNEDLIIWLKSLKERLEGMYNPTKDASV